MSISNILIVISIIFTSFSFIYPQILILGMNNIFLNSGNYIIYFLQFFTSNFLHGGIMHLLFNSIFIYYFGNILEGLIGKKKFILFFIFVVFFNGIAISILSSANTIGISGFAMALLTYYTLELKSRKMDEYKGGITALILNIGIGLAPGVSLVGHLFGFIAGLIFYFLNKDYLKKVMSPIKKFDEEL